MHDRADAHRHALTAAVALLFLALPALAGFGAGSISGGGTAGTITLDAPAGQGTLVRDGSLVVAGTLSNPQAVLRMNGAPIEVAPSGAFAAPAALEEGVNAFRLVAVTSAGGHSELLFTVTRDTMPPALEVLSPAPFAVLPDDRATVFGLAERGAVVTVAGVPVDVNPFDGSFLARDVPLAPAGTGCLQATDILVSAVDEAGNRAAATVPVYADQCVEHPEAALALPTLPVVAGQAAAYIDLAAYFVDDGGAQSLVFSTQPTGDAVGAVAASYGHRTLSLTWSDTTFRGTALFEVTARDREGLVSDPTVLRLEVTDGLPPAAPTLALAGALDPLPAGGSVSVAVQARTGAGQPAALEVLDVPRGVSVGTRLASGPAAGTYVVTVGAEPTLPAGSAYAFILLAHGPAGEVSTLPVSFRVYDASGDPGLTLQSPSPPEVDRIIQGPGGAYGAWVEVSSARTLPHLYTEEPVPGRVAAEAEPLNAERTYFRFFAALPSTPGIAHVRVWVQDPGLSPVMGDLVLNVLPLYGPPQIQRLFITGPEAEPTEGRAVSFDWQGFVPDPDRTTYTWKVDGRVMSHQRQLVGVQMDVGVHTVTLEVDSPQGSTAASQYVTVHAAPPLAPPPVGPLANWPWILLISFAAFGLVMAGTEIGAYMLVVWIVGALIDRQSREKLLAHFVRGRIYQIIQYEPGIHLSELQRKAGVARGVCAYHLHALEKAGLIKTSRDGMYLRFTATKVPVDTDTYALTEDERELLHAVQATPGISERELVASLGRSPPAVARTAKKLSQSGYLEAHKAGGETIWYPRSLGGLGSPGLAEP